MLALEDLRKVEVKTGMGSWEEVTLGQLETGDVFRMFEPNGDPVVNSMDNTTEWVVETPAAIVIRHGTDEHMFEVIRSTK